MKGRILETVKYATLLILIAMIAYAVFFIGLVALFVLLEALGIPCLPAQS